jgi:hypothetical protein
MSDPRQTEPRRWTKREKLLLEAIHALTCWSRNGTQLCFKTGNGIPMGMPKRTERIVRAALTQAQGVP